MDFCFKFIAIIYSMLTYNLILTALPPSQF